MTHQDECPAIDDLTALLIEHGPAAMASALATLMNHAMQIEREQVLEAEPRSVGDRQGYANGFKPKTLKTRVGQVDLRIPQTRGYHDENGRPFSPRSLVPVPPCAKRDGPRTQGRHAAGDRGRHPPRLRRG